MGAGASAKPAEPSAASSDEATPIKLAPGTSIEDEVSRLLASNKDAIKLKAQVANLSAQVASLTARIRQLGFRFTVAQYNILAGYLGNNTEPWFMYGVDMPPERRAEVVKRHGERGDDGKYVNVGWPKYVKGILSDEEIAKVEAVDQADFSWEARKLRVRALFERFDYNGDGVLSASEFHSMLGAMSSVRLTRAEAEQMYQALVSLGGGVIHPDDLQQMLHVKSERQRAHDAQRSGDATLDLRADEALAALARTWEAVRNAVALEFDAERWAYLSSPAVIAMLVRVQARCRGLLLRARRRATRQEEASLAPDLVRSTLVGERMPRPPGMAAASPVEEPQSPWRHL